MPISARHGRKPDLSVYFPTTRMPPRRGPVGTPPDLMVEVISLRPRDVRRDRVEKLDEYARFGVRHHWLVDPEARILECYALDDEGRYVRAAGATNGVTTVPAFEGLALDLDDLWRETERLAEGE